MVNITEFQNPEQIPDEILPLIFEKQWELAKKYAEIEKMDDLLTEKRIATNLDTQFGQVWIKDFAWRVTEELTESAEPIVVHDVITDDLKLHYLEELADALHFMTEMCIIAGITTDDLSMIEHVFVAQEDCYNIQQLTEEQKNTLKLNHWEVVYQLGLFCNCLKQKKWKITGMQTDRPKAIEYVTRAFYSLIYCMKSAGCSNEDIYCLYFKKNQVNMFRQRSNY
jgi:dimeric dUTPase (all-alpha-NTP-PPase superfamily)